MVALGAPSINFANPNLVAANCIAVPLLNSTNQPRVTAAGVEPEQLIRVQPRTGIVSDLHSSVVTPVSKQRFNVPGAAPYSTRQARALNVSPGTTEMHYGTRVSQF